MCQERLAWEEWKKNALEEDLKKVGKWSFIFLMITSISADIESKRVSKMQKISSQLQPVTEETKINLSELEDWISSSGQSSIKKLDREDSDHDFDLDLINEDDLDISSVKESPITHSKPREDNQNLNFVMERFLKDLSEQHDNPNKRPFWSELDIKAEDNLKVDPPKTEKNKHIKENRHSKAPKSAK